MDIKTFKTHHTPQEYETLAASAGTKTVYLDQIASGFRQPSGHLALKLETASGFKITRHELRPDLYPENPLQPAKAGFA